MKKLFLILGVVLIGGIAMCSTLLSQRLVLRYKMTVSVETPEGIKTGSAVREAGRHHEESIFPGQGGTFFNIIKGEAVAVDLGQRGVLFALLGGQGEAQNVLTMFAENKAQGVVTLTPEKYPMFVMFRDLNDPKTVDQVCEKVQCEKVDQAYHHITVKEVSIEITKEPVTWGIEKFLPWLHGLKSNIDGTSVTFSNTLSNSLDVGSFQTGEKQ